MVCVKCGSKNIGSSENKYFRDSFCLDCGKLLERERLENMITPCPVGATVYALSKDNIVTAHRIYAGEFDGTPFPIMKLTGISSKKVIRTDSIGKQFFFTEQEAYNSKKKG